MERDDEAMLNTLLETIRQEFNTIIENESESKTTTKTSFESPISIDDTNLENSTETCETEIAQKVSFLNEQASKTIDDDLQKMQLDLQNTYELFQTIGDKFETMNFGMLKNRVKNLHTSLSANGNDIGNDAIAELRQLFQQSYLDNRLQKLTTEVTEKLHHHPGEFGDIPEVSAFFKTCSQLQHGLKELERQREQVSDLGKRLCWATEISFDRVNEIRKQVAGQQDEADSPDSVYQLPE